MTRQQSAIRSFVCTLIPRASRRLGLACLLVGLSASAQQSVTIRPGDNGRTISVAPTSDTGVAYLPKLSNSVEQWQVTVICQGSTYACKVYPQTGAEINNTSYYQITAGGTAVIKNRGTDFRVVGAEVSNDGLATNVPGSLNVAATILGNFTVGSPGAGQTALPSAASASGKIYSVVDCESASACTTGGGSVPAFLRSNGSTWALASGGSTTTPLPTPGSTCTFTAPSSFCICTTTCTVTVPVPAAGYQFCAWNDTNVSTAITLSAIGTSAMYENTARTAYGTAGTGTFTATAALGNSVCLVGRDATHYQTVSFVGTWTAN